MKNKSLLIVAVIAIILLLSLMIIQTFSLQEKTINNRDNQSLDKLSKLTLQVNIPCPGHASLIISELLKAGISNVNFKFPNYFDVYYNPSKISKVQILKLNTFKEYSASVNG